jgi:hypothetical protein
MLNPPAGCAFHPRCPIARADAGCDTEVPALFEAPVGIVTGTSQAPAVDTTGHGAACWRRDDAATLLGVVHS